MGKPVTVGWAVLGVLVASALARGGASGPDECAGNTEASESWQVAWPLVPPVTCNGILDVSSGVIDRDWYYVDVGPLVLQQTLTATICPGPLWGPDQISVEIYFQPLGALAGSLLGPGTLRDATPQYQNFCDSASASASLDVVPNGRWYVRALGQGDYKLTVTVV